MLLGDGLADRAAKWGSSQELWEKEEISGDGEKREGLRRLEREERSQKLPEPI